MDLDTLLGLGVTGLSITLIFWASFKMFKKSDPKPLTVVPPMKHVEDIMAEQDQAQLKVEQENAKTLEEQKLKSLIKSAINTSDMANPPHVFTYEEVKIKSVPKRNKKKKKSTKKIR